MIQLDSKLLPSWSRLGGRLELQPFGPVLGERIFELAARYLPPAEQEIEIVAAVELGDL